MQCEMARGTRGRGRGARGGRGRGRGRGRGLVMESADASVAHETMHQQASESQMPQGSVSVDTVGVDTSAGVASGAQGPGGGAGAGGAQDREDRLAGLLQLILERLPGGVPAPGVQPVVAGVEPVAAGVQPRAAGVQPGVAAAEELPSYLRMMEQMQRIGTGFFSGGAKPGEADLWRSRLERNFQSLRCPEGYRVDLAVHYLEGDAHLWWRGVVSRRSQAGMVWEDFLAEFNAKYFPQEAVDRLELQFLELAQRDRTVREYDEEFGRLLVHAGREYESEQAQVKRFMRGLRPDLRTRCRPSRFATRAELVETAAAIEEDLRAEQAVVVSPPVQQQRRPQQSAGSSRGGKPAQGQKRKWESTSGPSQRGQSGSGCFGCGSMDHRVASCPKRSESRAAQVCFHCREPGHIRPRCPKLQMAVAVIQPGQGVAAEVQPLRQVMAPRAFTSVEAGGSSARPITGIFPNLS